MPTTTHRPLLHNLVHTTRLLCGQLAGYTTPQEPDMPPRPHSLAGLPSHAPPAGNMNSGWKAQGESYRIGPSQPDNILLDQRQ